MAKKKKYDPLSDIMDITKINVASTVGVVAINSMPSTPQVPAMESAKGFAGTSMGLMSTITSGKALINSLEGLDDLSKPKKRRR